MNASLITFGAVGLLALALVWLAYTVNSAARQRDRELNERRKKADALWAQTLEVLKTERVERRIDKRRNAGAKPRRVA